MNSRCWPSTRRIDPSSAVEVRKAGRNGPSEARGKRDTEEKTRARKVRLHIEWSFLGIHDVSNAIRNPFGEMLDFCLEVDPQHNFISLIRTNSPSRSAEKARWPKSVMVRGFKGLIGWGDDWLGDAQVWKQEKEKIRSQEQLNWRHILLHQQSVFAIHWNGGVSTVRATLCSLNWHSIC